MVFTINYLLALNSIFAYITVMKQINQIPQSDLVYSLRRLNEVAKIVAYAKSESEAEYFTMKYLRPLIEQTEALLKNEQAEALFKNE